jgi:putative sigma-54 modulation protein
VPKKQFFAKNQDDSFEAAADEAVEGLRRQLEKYKEKNG